MRTDVLLAVFAHPDDESLLVGGILAAAAAAGMRVVIVTATRGEAGAPPGSDAYAIRMTELERARMVLGASSATSLELPDGGLDLERARLAKRVASEVVRWRPEVILTFAADGWYWHADHVAVHDAVHELTSSLPPETSVYTTTWPRHRMTRFVRAVRSRRADADIWGLPATAFGSHSDTIDFVVDVGEYLDQKLEAISAHASQMEHGSLFRAAAPEVTRRYLGMEFLSVARQGTSELPTRLAAFGAPSQARSRYRPAQVTA